MDLLSTANAHFGFNLFKELKRIHDGNILFSPVGMSTAIGMVFLGTGGATASQLQKVLHFEKDTENSRIKGEEQKSEKTEEIHQQFQKFLTEIRKLPDDYELYIANRLFGEKTYLFLQKYLDYIEKYYHASLEPVDFINAAEQSRKKINAWVESQTNEKIKDPFSENSLSSSTKLVLINAIYLKGKWDREFKKENTKEEEFWLNKSTSKSVLMMAQYNSFSFVFLEDLQAKIVGIPYKNSDLSMFVLLPNDIDGLEKIIDKLTPEKLVEWTNPRQMEARNVSLHLPRLEVEDSYDLERVLVAMGLEDIFSQCEADYLGTCLQSRLQAQKFLHRSFLEVTEDGTEATAATGMAFTVSLDSGCEYVHCNHPFLFFIRHNESNNILFFGRFSSP
ncbi:serpin B13 isoform X1 [Heterocephalus glaber]|uniref:Serpin B10 n=1 Tax=Heterocephalus glaber TaxID=10181 RepID=A0AAX6PTR2_HETGA|nr:serpin B13 isoform X1 [Heterocephalus glaber]XP_021094942.1 serpin B13 isoform X1 [Heterocephalus glaber]